MQLGKFVTIDDCIQRAQELTTLLGELGKLKYPLDVRRGVKPIAGLFNAKMVKAASRAYFFDLKMTRDGKRFLVITESRLTGEGRRSEILVFSEDAPNFLAALQEMTAKLTRTQPNL